jgi:hypothetical protein
MTNGNVVQNQQPDRLDRIERIIESLASGQEHLLNAMENQEQRMEVQGDRINILIEGQLGLQAQMGLVSEQTLQLKRAVDYLLSRDGGAS